MTIVSMIPDDVAIIYNEPMPPQASESIRLQDKKLKPSLYRKINKPASRKEPKEQQKVNAETTKIATRILSLHSTNDKNTETNFISTLRILCVGYKQKRTKEYEASVKKIAKQLFFEFSDILTKTYYNTNESKNISMQIFAERVLNSTPSYQYIESAVVLDVLCFILNPEKKFCYSENDSEGCGCAIM